MGNSNIEEGLLSDYLAGKGYTKTQITGTLHQFRKPANTVFRANHSSKVVPLEGRLPHDKPRLPAELDALLASRELDQRSPGPPVLWL